MLAFANIILLLTACNNLEGEIADNIQEADFSIYTSDEVVDSGPASGGTLKLFSTEPDTLNPITTENIYVRDFLSLVYEGLTAVDASQKAIPVLAERWEVSSDGLTWTFYIRGGVEWHDGKPLTASDVEFTFNMISNGSIFSAYEYNLRNIASYSAVDSGTFRLLLKKPNAFTELLMTMPIVPKHVLTEDILSSALDIEKPVGTGPFRFVSYEKEKSVRLEANKEWWNSPNTDGEGLPEKPYIDVVEVAIYKDASSAAEAFQDKETDILYIDDIDYEKYSARTDIAIKKFPGRNYDFIAFNLSKPATGLVNVRKAIASCMDRSGLVQNLLSEIAVEADIPVIQGTWMNNAPPDSGGPDIQECIRLLEEEGFTEDDRGYYKYIKGVRTRLELELLVNDDNRKRVEIANELASQLAKGGITLKVTALKWDEVFKRVEAGKYDLLLTGIRIPSIPDVSYLYSYPYMDALPSADTDTAWNICDYNDETVDGYIKSIFSQNDEALRKALFLNMKQKLEEDVPYIGICFYNNAVLYNKRLRGSISPHVWNRLNGVEGWYIPGS